MAIDEPNGAPAAQSSTDIDMATATEPAGEDTLPDAPSEMQPETAQNPQSQSQSQTQTQTPPPPPGPRASRLQDVFASSLHHTLAKISWPNFAACYPTAAARNPVALQTVHRAMVDRLGQLCAAEFAAVLRNRDVVRRLNELEDLSRDASQRRRAATSSGSGSGSGSETPKPPPPPHTLPPEAVLGAHLKPQRKAQRQLLQERLAAAQAANTAKFALLSAQQAEAEQLITALERALADAAGAAALLDGEGEGEGEGEHGTSGDAAQLMAELARETRTAEAEMASL